jgi:Do/DeqQ family serine protease
MRAYRLLIPALSLLAACSNPLAKSNAQPADSSAVGAATDGGGPLAGPPLADPGRRIPDSAGAMRLSFAPVVRKATPAVVNVFSRQIVRQAADPFWQMFGGGMGVPRDRIAQSLGSGVIVRADGVIVTNNHVIAGGQEIRVVLGDRREFPAKVLLADAHADIAILKIDVGHESLPVLALDDRDDAQVGDLVLAIGDPFGVGQTVTNGIVSAIARTGVGITDVSYFIQTDAAINPGNSGGALVDMNGDMIGMNTAILSQSGTSSGIGFAIPAALVKRVVEQALGGHAAAVGRPWLGLKTQDVTADIASSMGLARPEGVLVTDLYPDGPGARAGLRQGDLITAIDGQPVNDAATLNYRVATRRSGDQIALTVRRGKAAERTISLRVETPPGGATTSEMLISGRNPLDGATVIDLTPAAAEQLGVDPFAADGGGVLVTKVGDGFAGNIGLQPGDLIRDINGQPVTSVKSLKTLLSAGAHSWRMTIQRGDQKMTVQVQL